MYLVTETRIHRPTLCHKLNTNLAPTFGTKTTPNPAPTPTPAPEPRVQVLPPVSDPRLQNKSLEDPYQAHNKTDDPYHRTPPRLPVRPSHSKHDYFTQSGVQGFLAQSAISKPPETASLIHTSNYNFYPTPGTKISIDKIITGQDGKNGRNPYLMNLVGWPKA